MSLSVIANIVLLLLKIIDGLTSYLYQQKYQDIGYDKAMAEMTASTLKRSEYANKIMAKISNLDNDAVDDFLQRIEDQRTGNNA